MRYMEPTKGAKVGQTNISIRLDAYQLAVITAQEWIKRQQSGIELPFRLTSVKVAAETGIVYMAAVMALQLGDPAFARKLMQHIDLFVKCNVPYGELVQLAQIDAPRSEAPEAAPEAPEAVQQDAQPDAPQQD